MNSKFLARFALLLALLVSLLAYQNCSLAVATKLSESPWIVPLGGGDGYPGRPIDSPDDCFPNCQTPDNPDEGTEPEIENYVSVGQCGNRLPAIVDLVRLVRGQFDLLKENCAYRSEVKPVNRLELKPMIRPAGFIYNNTIFNVIRSPQPFTMIYCESPSDPEGRAQVATFFGDQTLYGQDSYNSPVTQVTRTVYDGDLTALQLANGNPGPSIPVGTLVYRSIIAPNQVGHFAVYYGSGDFNSAIVFNTSARGKQVFSGVKCWIQESPIGF